ncbi:hypothetical protein OESDEN_08009 [Oesophagostomum dentatum]|uniref:RING-type domain-containing protein n=1 Tax=Oesophagostomum dentatum TaxID=61180 RepID=A0A0B1T8J8_OESDE|nr:hypothetical protein OESDEN_08009 [Oesophagostomum dentatum]
MPAESEDEDETWGLREVTLNEYLRATSEERLRMSKWYGGIEKLEAKMEEAIKKSDYSSFIWVQKNSRKCPQCSIPIQKAEGCNNMVCTMCDTLFCYKCGEIISRNITFPFYLVKASQLEDEVLSTVTHH